MNATIVPFQLGKRRRQLVPWKQEENRDQAPCTTPSSARTSRVGRHTKPARRLRPSGSPGSGACPPRASPRGAIPICDLRPHSRARVAGRIRTVHVTTGRGLVARMHDFRRDRASHGRVPGPPSRHSRHGAGGTGRGRGHGRKPRSQRRDGKPPLLGDLNPGPRRAFFGRVSRGNGSRFTVDGLFTEGRCPGLAPDRRHLSRRSKRSRR